MDSVEQFLCDGVKAPEERVGVNSKKNDGWKESQNKPVMRVSQPETCTLVGGQRTVGRECVRVTTLVASRQTESQVDQEPYEVRNF